MTVILTPITLPQLTEATTTGSGVFDVLMKATKAHLEQEFTQGRIKGAEYATVYLGSLEAVMQNALQFLLQKDKVALDAELVKQQVELAKADLLIKQVELEKTRAELTILEKTVLKTGAEVALLTAQADTERAKLPLMAAQVDRERANITMVVAQEAMERARTAMTGAQTSLINAQTANEALQGKVLIAQECKLRAEYDVLLSTDLKTKGETSLLLWKTNTEKAQTLALGVDDNSVIGKQKALYGAQTDGFKRDAEQKAAKLLADTWSVRRTTDEATVADATNKLNDATVGRAIEKLLSGIGA